MPAPPDFIPPKECARLLGIARRTLAHWHETGCGPPAYILEFESGRIQRRYLRSEIVAWRDKHYRRSE